jgi:NAD(P)-dependent dehydrogenase (short-subunit alcohol dehydrogenase family)
MAQQSSANRRKTMSNQIENKVVVITGAAGEIGRALVVAFVEAGAKVVAADLDQDALSRMVKDLADGGDKIVTSVTNVAIAAEVQDCVAVALDKFGRLDSFINNAGTEGFIAPIEDYPEDAFDKVLAVNVRCVFLGIKYAIPALRKNGGGSIINMASVSGLTGGAGTSAYNASKHAVIGLTRSGAVQLGAENIRVNAVCPSPMNGRMMKSIEAGANPDDPAVIHDMLVGRIPMNRYAEAEDIVNLVLFLTSDKAQFINGGVYTVDGGMTAAL